MKVYNDFNDECENCWCYECKNNSLADGECENCNKCSSNNVEKRHKYQNNNWKMNCKKFKYLN